MLTDQSYPPVLISGSGQKCIKVARLEHGSLMELAEGLIHFLRGRYMVAGSVILIFSATNLATSGTSGYVADWLDCRELLRKRVGGHVIIGPLPHFFGPGCSDPATIRAGVEVGAWFERQFRGDDSFLRESFRKANQTLAVICGGGPQPEVITVHRLATIDKKMENWTTGGLPLLPMMARRAEEAEERELVEAIIA
jgi:uncharacterized membrane protein